MMIVPTTSGTPTSANSKYPKVPVPASYAASETSTFTGVPVRASWEPACAANAIGSRSCDVACRWRTAVTTTMGSRAATAPFTLMMAVRPAANSIVKTTSRRGLSPARAVRRWPAQAVTPVASRAVLTTKSVAMKTTVGSPKPSSVWLMSMTPAARSVSDAPSATISTGSRFQMKRTTVTPRTPRTTVISLISFTEKRSRSRERP